MENTIRTQWPHTTPAVLILRCDSQLSWTYVRFKVGLYAHVRPSHAQGSQANWTSLAHALNSSIEVTLTPRELGEVCLSLFWPDMRLLSWMFRFYSREPTNLSLPEKNMSVLYGGALKLVSSLGLLTKFRSFFAAFPMVLITIFLIEDTHN